MKEKKDSLKNTYPNLAKEWHPTLNGNLTPDDVTKGVRKRVWWKCEKGHEWESAVYSRSIGCGCPYCAGKLPIKGETDLATLRPELVKEWHPTLNGDWKPNEVCVNSGKKAWWKCEKGHSWETTIGNRSAGKGCPYCAGHLPIEGETDLATLRPGLAKEWHPILNGDRTPNKVTLKSNIKVWWKCEKGHEWQSVISNRSKGADCPFCTGKRPIKGETDLETLRPDLVLDWDVEKNGKSNPEDYTIYSGRKVNWKCHICGMQWRATVYARSMGQSNCFRCRRSRV